MKKTPLHLLITTAFLAAFPLSANASGHSPPEQLTDFSLHDEAAKGSLPIELTGRYISGAEFGAGGAEIVAYDERSKQIFSVNGDEESIDILDGDVLTESTTFTDIPLKKRLFVEDLDPSLSNVSDLTSIAVHPTEDIIAVTTVAEPKTNPGSVLFLTSAGEHLSTVEVGALPDMITFTPDGDKLLVANEGEPSEDYNVNPKGSVSIIDVSQDVEKPEIVTAGFTDEIVDDDVRKVHPEASYAEDLEPEFIAVNEGSSLAYIVLQENNAIATLDLEKGAFTSVQSFGWKDHSETGNGMDASDKDGKINIQEWPVLGIHQPDAITLYETNEKTYIVTPNEGDAQDYDGFSEEARAAELEDKVVFNADLFSGYSQEDLDQLIEDDLFADENLGRLNVTTSAPTNEDGKYEALYAFGGRSFSIFDADTMELVFDSGDEFEQKLAEMNPDFFNTDHEEDVFDDRSDNKGPEPETVELAEIDGKTYAFIALERDAGLFVYDITNPAEASYETYFSTRDFDGQHPISDNAPEGLKFIPADKSPSGKPTLLASYEISGTVASFTVGAGDSSTKESETLHTVQPGETLFEIGLRYNYLWTTLEKTNSLENPHLIYPGDQLMMK
ncbi:choice-of-anchor I family protein [Oceanobacillus sp. CFH 90083]|uniref:choice-of-anchor I family protein n=1 Tax=Oceanobacillus sp. CFH 90083 TaxID=2592336 RepID=UPI0018835EC9|nr:choice-of-anchor I family protein [Oceanobacillus sp. CFH 90083]